MAGRHFCFHNLIDTLRHSPDSPSYRGFTLDYRAFKTFNPTLTPIILLLVAIIPHVNVYLVWLYARVTSYVSTCEACQEYYSGQRTLTPGGQYWIVEKLVSHTWGEEE